MDIEDQNTPQLPILGQVWLVILKVILPNHVAQYCSPYYVSAMAAMDARKRIVQARVEERMRSYPPKLLERPEVIDMIKTQENNNTWVMACDFDGQEYH